MIAVDLSEIKYNEETGKEIAKKYGLDKVEIIKPEVYDRDYLKEKFNENLLSLISAPISRSFNSTLFKILFI